MSRSGVDLERERDDNSKLILEDQFRDLRGMIHVRCPAGSLRSRFCKDIRKAHSYEGKETYEMVLASEGMHRVELL